MAIAKALLLITLLFLCTQSKAQKSYSYITDKFHVQNSNKIIFSCNHGTNNKTSSFYEIDLTNQTGIKQINIDSLGVVTSSSPNANEDEIYYIHAKKKN